MSDTTERDAVRAEFYARHAQAKTLSAVRVLIVADMADEIVRLRRRSERAERVLAKLKKPSEAAWVAALGEYNDGPYATHPRPMRLAAVIRAAVEAAEKEVNE